MIKLFRAIVPIQLMVMLLMSITSSYAQQTKTIFQTGFDDRDELDQWDREGRIKIVDKDGQRTLKIVNGILKIPIPKNDIKGGILRLSCKIKAQSVSTPLHPWNGIKVMIHVSLPWDDMWPQAKIPLGSFDWTDADVSTNIPYEADSVEVYIGLQESTGKLWVDNLNLISTKATEAETPYYVDVHKHYSMDADGKRYRGVMVPTLISDSGLYELAKWNVNIIRWQITRHGFPYSQKELATKEGYYKLVDSALKRGDKIIALCNQLGIKVIVDLHHLPGGEYNGTDVNSIFKDKDWQNVFLDVWNKIAERYKNTKAVIGYDLANEPIEGSLAEGVMNWYDLATVTAQNIRKIDTVHSIIFEAAPRGLPEALTTLKPIPVPGMVYSMHYYYPAMFTLQNIDVDGEEIEYPGVIGSKEWNIETMRKSLQPLINWQKKYNAHIYVGEFSAIRWAPKESAYYYINDCVNLFEEAGWDWTYHAFREWEGWSVEIGNDKNNSNYTQEPTERKRFLLKWFAKNSRH